MSAYRETERTVARALESMPWLRHAAKAAYHRANYLCFGERGFRCSVDARVRLVSPAEWLGTALPPLEGLFFGYYDKSPWSPNMQQLILHRIRPDGRVDILLLDRPGRSWRVVGESPAWNCQQGAMAQWLPWSGGARLIFNDCVNGRLVAQIVGLDGSRSLVPLPVQAVHPAAPEALSLNYRRLARLRPEYGYAVEVSNFAPDQAPERDGIWHVDLESGASWLLVSLAALMATAPRAEMRRSEHKVNHALYSPGGSRFAFLHRWLGPRGKFSRLYTADADGASLRLHLDDRMVSHYAWLDEERLLAWARSGAFGDGYHLLDVVTGEQKAVGRGILDGYGDGHPSFSPDGRWILTDSYPDRARQRHLLLYERATGRLTELGRFIAPWHFDGAARCDLHPRWSPDGRWISIDSAHTGMRMTFLLELQ